MWIFSVLFHLNIIFGSKALIVGPTNTAVTVGQTMEMRCQVDSGLIVREWSIQKMLISKAEPFFTNWKNRSSIINAHFGVEVDEFGSGIIYINSTTLDDAGIYICTIGLQGGKMQPQKYSAHLVVFERDPLCHSNSTLPLNATIQKETFVWMRCTINFRGYLVPVIEWRQHKGVGEDYGEGQDITNLADTEIISNTTVTSDLTLVLKSITYSISYSCKIYFKPNNVTQMTIATNAPEYSYIYTWKAPVVVVASIHLRSDLPTILAAVLVSLVVALSLTAIIRCIIHRKPSSREPVTEILPMTSRQATSIPNVHECNVNQYSRKPNYMYVGDDGTEYMEVNAICRQPMPVRLPAETNLFSVVEVYACIDHTISPPIPARGKLF